MQRPAIIGLALLLGLALAGGGFVAGMTVERSRGDAATGSPAPGAGQRVGPGGAGGRQAPGGAQGRALNGEVLSVGDGTITVRLGQQEGSRIVLVAPSTRLVRTIETTVQLAEVRAGERVTIVGSENSDGSVNAQAVVVGGTNVLQQILGSPRPSPSPAR